jgi:hypothetical protein
MPARIMTSSIFDIYVPTVEAQLLTIIRVSNHLLCIIFK